MSSLRMWSFAALVGILTMTGCQSEPSSSPEVTLKLGGKFCEFYQDAVKSALMEVKGVKTVDLEGKEGHAVVTGDPATLRASALKNAVDGVKGEGWHCEAAIVE